MDRTCSLLKRLLPWFKVASIPLGWVAPARGGKRFKPVAFLLRWTPLLLGAARMLR